MEDKLRVNIKIMDITNDKKIDVLVDGLKKIEGFDFFVEAQFDIT